VCQSESNIFLGRQAQFPFLSTDIECEPANGDLTNLATPIKVPFVYPNHALTGRSPHYQRNEDLFQDIASGLGSAEKQAPARPRLCFLTGLGGSGKTELVRDYVAQHRLETDIILFIVADNRERLSQQYAEIAKQLGLLQSHNASDTDFARERLKIWLGSPVKHYKDFLDVVQHYTQTGQTLSLADDVETLRWTLVLDDAGSRSVLADFLPSSGPGVVLVTSRMSSAWKSFYPHAGLVEVNGLSEAGAATLLKALSGTAHDDEENNAAALRLAKQLDYLPIALQQVGLIVAERSLSLVDFVRDYDKSSSLATLLSEQSLNDDDDDEEVGKQGLWATWAFDDLAKQDTAAWSLLGVLSMLDTALIQEQILFHCLTDAATSGYPCSKDQYHSAIGSLTRRSLIHKDRATGAVSISRLVQAVARMRLIRGEHAFTTLFNLAWESVAKLFPYRDEEMNTAGAVKRWERCASVYQHAVKLCHTAQELMDRYPDTRPSLEFLDLIYEAAW
jgi:hypothetical protein